VQATGGNTYTVPILHVIQWKIEFTMTIGDSKWGGTMAPLFNFFEIAEEMLQYRLALLFLAFFMFLASILSHFQMQKSCSFWGLYPQTPA